jgi:dual specificity protein kinase YAK1
MDELTDPATGRVYVAQFHVGQGEFGRVYKMAVKDSPTLQFAVKISKANPEALDQFQCEADLLRGLWSDHGALDFPADYFDTIIRFDSSFEFRGHFCIVTEPLGPNLHKILVYRKFTGLGLDLLQKVLSDTLKSLVVLHSFHIVHADVKPENILQKSITSEHVKLIDFGSAIRSDDEGCDYAQTRLYRAPEVILRIGISTASDVWSLGCVAAELVLGIALMSGQSEAQMLFLMAQRFGPFDPEFVSQSPVCESYFGADGALHSAEELGCEDLGRAKRIWKWTRLDDILLHSTEDTKGSPEFLARLRPRMELLTDLLMKMLVVDPAGRISARDALEHPFMKLEIEGDP